MAGEKKGWGRGVEKSGQGGKVACACTRSNLLLGLRLPPLTLTHSLPSFLFLSHAYRNQVDAAADQNRALSLVSDSGQQHRGRIGSQCA